MRATNVLVIFAKRPVAGRVKTRLARGELPGFGPLSLEQAARIYEAFLVDYSRRFSALEGISALFCVPSRDADEALGPLCAGALPCFAEPCWDGRAASDIGESIAFTMRALLDQGAEKVVILGSDLPCLPLGAVAAALALLDDHPLALGDDGGGCYLVAASAPPEALEGGRIRWSEGRDFAAIVAAQRELGKTVGILEEIYEDIDGPAQLGRLIDRLRVEPALRRELSATCACLRALGLEIPES
jgi:uncharacterized protein